MHAYSTLTTVTQYNILCNHPKLSSKLFPANSEFNSHEFLTITQSAERLSVLQSINPTLAELVPHLLLPFPTVNSFQIKNH